MLFVPFVSETTVVEAKRSRRTPVFKSFLPRPACAPSSHGLTGALLSKDETALSPAVAGVCDSSRIRSPLSSDGLTNIQEMVDLTLRTYVPLEELDSLCSPRICGSWVAALPELTTNVSREFAGCLDSAVSTLALSIIAHRSQEDLFQVALARYENSIRYLVDSLAEVGDSYRNELVAAVMCLALSEVSPDNHKSLLHRAPLSH